MYLYQITNLINNKLYIGITNNYKKRWNNHKCCNSPNMAIAKAIKKYGVENFKFELLYSGLSIEEADELEKKLIKEKNSMTPNGYNIKPGGHYQNGIPKYGYENSNAHLSYKEAKYIKDNRNIPMYVLYDDFSEKISYEAFKKIYLDITYKNIKPSVDIYPYNFEFSCQFNASPIDYGEVVELRQRYANGEYWKDVYQDYKDIYTNEWSFWQLYNGKSMSLVMPEVFTKENKKKHTKNCALLKQGENNGRAKLNAESVKDIRKMFNNSFSRDDICKKYNNITRASINAVLRGETWKHLL